MCQSQLTRQGVESFEKLGLSYNTYHHLTQRLLKTALKTGWISIRIRADVQSTYNTDTLPRCYCTSTMYPQISHKLPADILEYMDN